MCPVVNMVTRGVRGRADEDFMLANEGPDLNTAIHKGHFTLALQPTSVG